METIEQRLRDARVAAGYKSAANAIRRFGWTSSTYYCAESGLRGLTRTTLARYAGAYKVSVDWLLTGQGNPTPHERSVLLSTFDLLSPGRQKMLLDTAEMFRADQERDSSSSE